MKVSNRNIDARCDGLERNSLQWKHWRNGWTDCKCAVSSPCIGGTPDGLELGIFQSVCWRNK
jgi:hypothetical protein